MQLRYQLSPRLGALLPTEVLNLDPTETKATCHACAMAKPRTRAKYPYQEDLKCCTFHPWIPNYAVGEILAHPQQATAYARQVIQNKISRREYALPLGVVPSLRYQIEFNARKPGEFGQRKDWLCPYYDQSQQMCGLWRWRGSVCTGYYCKSNSGKDGLKFWKHLERYLAFIESALMEECLAQLDFSPRQVSDLLGYINRFEGTKAECTRWTLPLEKAKKLWNGYFDDVEGFYIRCDQIVSSLTPSYLNELLGDHGEYLFVEMIAASRKLV